MDFTATPTYLLEAGINNLYVKREDLIPYSFGGNKARKALLFWEDFQAQGADCVVTYGSSSSNHCRVVANLAAGQGVPCHIISPEQASQPTYNSKMMELFGAKIQCVDVSQVATTIDKTLEQLRAAGKNPYFIAGGGHGNLGTEAYVRCFQEIRQFEAEHGIIFDYIFHASGTGTTQAGLIAGKLMAESPAEIIGISIARKNPRGGAVVMDSVAQYAQARGLDFSRELIEKNTHFIDSYVSEGYGSSNGPIQQTIIDVLERHGIPLDETYTAKAWWGMEDYLASHGLEQKNILFIHTGGTPLFFDALASISQHSR